VAAWRQAYDELVTGRYPALVAYASLLTASPEEADEATRAALVRVFGRLRPPPTSEAADAAVRCAIVARAASGRRSVPDVPRKVEGEPEDAHERLRALDAVTRACVVLRYADELPVAEVADRLRIGHDDVRSRLTEAGELMGDLVDAAAAEQDIMIIDVRGDRGRA